MFEHDFLQIIIRGGLTMGVLALFSIFSLAAIGERFYVFRRSERGSRDLPQAVFQYLASGKVGEALVLCDTHPAAHVATVLKAGLREVAEAVGGNPGLHGGPALERSLQAAAGAMQRATTQEITRLERYLGALATLGNISPFVGLFGTVIGIIKAFEAIARTGSGGLGTVSAGIAEALVATAAGLFVAIPAVIAYNYYVGRVKRCAAEMDSVASELLERVQKLAAA